MTNGSVSSPLAVVVATKLKQLLQRKLDFVATGDVCDKIISIINGLSLRHYMLECCSKLINSDNLTLVMTVELLQMIIS